LSPSDRFRLATLVLNEIPAQSVVDVRDAWTEQDMRDAAAYSARLFAAEYPEEATLLKLGALSPFRDFSASFGLR
jgi:hypothetical protein